MLNTIVIMAGTFQNVNSFFKKIIFYFCDSSPEARTETLCLDDDIKEKQKQKKGAQEEEEGLMRRGNKGFLPTKFHVLMICVWLCDDYTDTYFLF